MGDYMVTMLIIGDTHIPDRADHIPDKLLDIIENGKPWDIAVFTGDFTGLDVIEWFKKLGRETIYVAGNMDYIKRPLTQVFKVEDLAFGLHHGHGIEPRGDTRGLSHIASRLNVNILITGHTHSPFIKHGVTDNILLVNPGSLTGVWGGGGGSMKPSMMILDMIEPSLLFNLYEVTEGRLSILKKKVLFNNNKWIIVE